MRVVERPQLARTRELARCARAVQNLRVPQPVEILVEAARGEGIAGVERLVSRGVGEDQRQRAARRPEAAAQQPVERDRAAHFVAVRERLDRDTRPRSGRRTARRRDAGIPAAHRDRSGSATSTAGESRVQAPNVTQRRDAARAVP